MSGVFDIDEIRNHAGAVTQVRLNEPCYITMAQSKGTFVAYIYVGDKYRTPGVQPDEDECPVYVVDTSTPRMFGRY